MPSIHEEGLKEKVDRLTNPQLMTKREWIKVHLMCGVKTNVVTAVQISDRLANDSPFLQTTSGRDGQEFRNAGSLC